MNSGPFYLIISQPVLSMAILGIRDELSQGQQSLRQAPYTFERTSVDAEAHSLN
jgi:hypothetical protein